jgi:hypothetical protein
MYKTMNNPTKEESEEEFFEAAAIEAFNVIQKKGFNPRNWTREESSKVVRHMVIVGYRITTDIPILIFVGWLISNIFG